MKTLFKITEKGHRNGRLFLSEKDKVRNAVKSRLSEGRQRKVKKELESSWCEFVQQDKKGKLWSYLRNGTWKEL
jgi:hypothetical protein